MCSLKGVYSSNIGVKQSFYNRLSSENDNFINIICDRRGICLKPCVTQKPRVRFYAHVRKTASARLRLSFN